MPPVTPRSMCLFTNPFMAEKYTKGGRDKIRGERG
jgi:hypothetical protein